MSNQNITELSKTVILLGEQVKKLSQRLDQIESDLPKRHTQSTTACFEDSIAVITDVLMEEEQQREFTRARLAQLMQILQEGRQGPHAYDPDRPAGKRIKKDDRTIIYP